MCIEIKCDMTTCLHHEEGECQATETLASLNFTCWGGTEPSVMECLTFEKREESI